MQHETVPPQEHIEGRFVSNRVVLGVSRTLLANTAEYVEYLETHDRTATDSPLYDDAAWDLLKRFYELASAQMAETVIDRRLFPNGEMTQPVEVLGAMDEVLASWQRGSIVTSQQEPLREFTLWLLDAQRSIVDEVKDATLRHRIERGIDMAEKRLSN